MIGVNSLLKRLKIAAFILAFREVPIRVLKCLSTQTVKPSKVIIVAAYESACVQRFSDLDIECIVIPPNLNLTVGERVGISLSVAFRKIRIEGYDYLLKLDDDVVFDERFIEDNVGSGYDLMGRGAAMIIRVEVYLKFFNHQWPINPIDDTYVVDTLLAAGYKVLPWSWIRRAIPIKEVHVSVEREFLAGVNLYKLGYPFTVALLASFSTLIIRRRSITGYIARVGGYIAALITRPSRYTAYERISKYKRYELMIKLKNLIQRLTERYLMM